ncbi:MAG TPA: YbaB/EbfC family nucleoid-associated protein [Atribacterota bacterium]|nr:YbaB/EbfC family nucleoid-associated protein [Atribacterota bacterium]HOR42521.1 YbaB/EbfC family nucleoid-associated protein [Atribacterota bacterium]HPK87794.1 YbaB/EbfC family nucleoid-associated protein [Atribacterota bacterium]
MDMRFLMKQAQEMQKKMEAIKEQLSHKELKVSSGGGMVELLINGQQEIKEIHINPDIIDPEDKEMLEDLVQAAVNEGIRQSKEMVNEEMKKLTGGINLPGLF